MGAGMTTWARGWPAAIALFLLALALLLPLARYNLWGLDEGWVVADEGHQAYQPLRVLAGQWYFRDFSTDNYPPGMVYLHAGLYWLFGIKMSVLRVFLAFVGAGIATLSFVVARRLAPAGFALVAFLLALSWNVTSLNIGFPSWYCVLLGLAALMAMLRYSDTEKPAWLLLAGVLVGLSFMMKTTQGAYQGLGLALFLAWRNTAGIASARRRLISWPAAFALASVALAVALLLGFPAPVNGLVFGVPIFLLALSVWAGRPAMSSPPGRPFLTEVGALFAGFAVVTAGWAIPGLHTMGVPVFVEGLLLAPLRNSQMMQVHIAPPTLNGWLLLVWAAGAVLVWRRRPATPWLLAYGLLGVLALFMPLAGPWTPREALRTAFQTWRGLRFFLPPLATVALWALLWRRGVLNAEIAPLMLLIAYGAWNMLQVFPFADSNHLLWSIQPAFIGLAYLLWRVAGRGEVSPARERRIVAPAAALAVVPAALIALQFYPVMGHFVSLDGGLQPVSYVLLDEERGDVYVREEVAGDLRAAAEAIRRQTGPCDTIFDTSGAFLYFLASRHNVTGYDYLWPGFLSASQVDQLVHDLDRCPPALVITRNTEEHVFGYASMAQTFPALARFIEGAYHRTVEVGNYTLWSPRSDKRCACSE